MKPLNDRGSYFDRAVVITLPQRRERLRHFYESWDRRLARDGEEGAPFGRPERFDGVNAITLGKPRWFRGSPGTWGCRWSHLRIIEDAANRGVERLLVFEDDACLEDGRPDLWGRLRRFLDAVPEDGWDFLQLGYEVRSELSERRGQFREAGWVVETHAMVYRGASLPRIYEELVSLEPVPRNVWLWPIDQHLAQLHRTGRLRRMLPRNSLIHQHKGFPSDIQVAR